MLINKNDEFVFLYGYVYSKLETVFCVYSVVIPHATSYIINVLFKQTANMYWLIKMYCHSRKKYCFKYMS